MGGMTLALVTLPGNSAFEAAETSLLSAGSPLSVVPQWSSKKGHPSSPSAKPRPKGLHQSLSPAPSD